jgi:hypothetical protein
MFAVAVLVGCAATEEPASTKVTSEPRSDPFHEALAGFSNDGDFARCSEQAPVYWSTRFNHMATANEERTGRKWVFKDALGRSEAAQEDGADGSLIKAYNDVWKAIGEIPECSDEARQVLKSG